MKPHNPLIFTINTEWSVVTEIFFRNSERMVGLTTKYDSSYALFSRTIKHLTWVSWLNRVTTKKEATKKLSNSISQIEFK